MRMWSRHRLTAAGAMVCVLASAGCASQRSPNAEDYADVSVGYGSQFRGQVAGSVSSVNADDLESARSIIDVLRTRVPGLAVINTPDGISLRIRGEHSLRGDQNPLIIIDGMVAGFDGGRVLTMLSPRDVERVDVLKDASTTGMYGVRGANGVIIITTKRGR